MRLQSTPTDLSAMMACAPASRSNHKPLAVRLSPLGIARSIKGAMVWAGSAALAAAGAMLVANCPQEYLD